MDRLYLHVRKEEIQVQLGMEYWRNTSSQV